MYPEVDTGSSPSPTGIVVLDAGRSDNIVSAPQSKSFGWKPTSF
jgi:hypothetical protein